MVGFDPGLHGAGPTGWYVCPITPTGGTGKHHKLARSDKKVAASHLLNHSCDNTTTIPSDRRNKSGVINFLHQMEWQMKEYGAAIGDSHCLVSLCLGLGCVECGVCRVWGVECGVCRVWGV